jgi:hypothetical protein
MMAKRKNSAAVSLGKRSAKARADKLGQEGLSEQNTKAINARWDRYRAEKKKQ